MDRKDIFNKLKDLAKQASTTNPEAIENCSESSDLRTDLGLTSIGVLYLAIALENSFEIEFEDDAFDKFKTVKDVVDYIEMKQN